jgi:cytochrome c oxidase cbb3-type subunit 3
MVSLRLADGTYRTIRTEGPNAPKVELRDPLKGHRELLTTYSDDDIHNITAFLVTLK